MSFVHENNIAGFIQDKIKTKTNIKQLLNNLDEHKKNL